MPQGILLAADQQLQLYQGAEGSAQEPGWQYSVLLAASSAWQRASRATKSVVMQIVSNFWDGIDDDQVCVQRAKNQWLHVLVLYVRPNSETLCRGV